MKQFYINESETRLIIYDGETKTLERFARICDEPEEKEIGPKKRRKWGEMSRVPESRPEEDGRKGRSRLTLEERKKIVKLMAKRGNDDAPTTKQIAEKFGVSIATVNNYWNQKNDAI